MIYEWVGQIVVSVLSFYEISLILGITVCIQKHAGNSRGDIVQLQRIRFRETENDLPINIPLWEKQKQLYTISLSNYFELFVRVTSFMSSRRRRGCDRTAYFSLGVSFIFMFGGRVLCHKDQNRTVLGGIFMIASALRNSAISLPSSNKNRSYFKPTYIQVSFKSEIVAFPPMFHETFDVGSIARRSGRFFQVKSYARLCARTRNGICFRRRGLILLAPTM